MAIIRVDPGTVAAVTPAAISTPAPAAPPPAQAPSLLGDLQGIQGQLRNGLEIARTFKELKQELTELGIWPAQAGGTQLGAAAPDVQQRVVVDEPRDAAPSSPPPPSEQEKALRGEIEILIKRISKPQMVELILGAGPHALIEKFPKTSRMLSARLTNIQQVLDACTEDELRDVLREMIGTRPGPPKKDLAFAKAGLLAAMGELGARNKTTPPAPRSEQETAPRAEHATPPPTGDDPKKGDAA